MAQIKIELLNDDGAVIRRFPGGCVISGINLDKFFTVEERNRNKNWAWDTVNKMLDRVLS